MYTEDVKKFIRFLKNHKSFHRYVHNFFNDPDYRHALIGFKEYLDATDTVDYLMNAFEWEKTNEGFFYWRNLNDTWRIQYKRNGRN